VLNGDVRAKPEGVRCALYPLRCDKDEDRGTWGTGVFENDGALDFMGDVVKEFTARIEAAITNAAFDVDRHGVRVVMPCVVVLNLLCERTNAVPPPRAQIAAWRERYLARYNAGYAPSGGGELAAFDQDRRAVVEAAFSELEAHAQTFGRADDALSP